MRVKSTCTHTHPTHPHLRGLVQGVIPGETRIPQKQPSRRIVPRHPGRRRVDDWLVDKLDRGRPPFEGDGVHLKEDDIVQARPAKGRVSGLVFRLRGLGFCVWGLGPGVWGLGFGVYGHLRSEAGT